MIWCGHGAASGWPRCRLFAAVRSAARTVQIGRAAVVLRKTPLSFRKSTRAPDVLSEFFTKKRLVLFPNQRSVRTGWALVCLQKRPPLYRKSTRAPQTLSPFFAKTSSDFSQIKIQPNFDYIFFFSKKYVWPVDRAHGRARKTSASLLVKEAPAQLSTEILSPLLL